MTQSAFNRDVKLLKLINLVSFYLFTLHSTHCPPPSHHHSILFSSEWVGSHPWYPLILALQVSVVPLPLRSDKAGQLEEWDPQADNRVRDSSPLPVVGGPAGRPSYTSANFSQILTIFSYTCVIPHTLTVSLNQTNRSRGISEIFHFTLEMGRLRVRRT